MNPYGNDLIVDQVIGSAYQVVKYVASNMEILIQLSDFIQTVTIDGLAELIEFLPELQEIHDNLPAIIDSSLVVAASREAIVRSYNEAGFPMNKTESFEVGGTISTAKETLLYEQNGVGYSWGGALPKSVLAGSTPSTTGGIGPTAWIDQSTKLLRQQLTAISGNITATANWADVPAFSDSELGGPDGPMNGQAKALAARTEYLKAQSVSVKDPMFAGGAKGDGVTNDKAAIEAAWAYSKNINFPAGVYYAPGLRLTGGSTDTQKSITSAGAVIKGDNLYISDMRSQYMENIKFEASVAIYIEGVRYCNWNSVEFAGLVKWGRYATALSSWSTYWNKFSRCNFKQGIELTLSISSANFNSNTFDTCEFRHGSQTALMTFLETVANDGVFVANTFIGCDVSYAPVFNIVTEYLNFSVLFLGGFIDTSTPWYAPGSYKGSVETFGIRNPSSTPIDTEMTADVRLTLGGAREKRNLPVGALSYFKTEQIPARCTGGAVRSIDSVPLPYKGHYSISTHFNDVGAQPFATIKFENLTAGSDADQYDIVEKNGFSTYTFKANKGDVIRLNLDGDTNTDVNVLLCALTAGAGVVDAVPYRAAYPSDITSVTAPSAVATNLITFTPGAYAEATFYRVEVYTTNMVSGGGGEKIILDIGVATGGAVIGVTLKEVTRCSVNGAGGTSDDSGTLALSMTTSGTTATLVGTLSGPPTSVVCKVKVFGGETAGQVA